MISETKSNKAENMRVKPSWIFWMLLVNGDFEGWQGWILKLLSNRKYLDDTLFIETVLINKFLYSSIPPKFNCDSGKIVEGSFFFNTDSKPD